MSSYAQVDKAAVISVYTVDSEPGKSSQPGIVEVRDASWNRLVMVNEYNSFLNSDIIPLFSFPFMQGEEVANTAGYNEIERELQGSYTKLQENGEMTFPGTRFVPSTDYIVIPASFGQVDKDAIIASFNVLPDDVDVVLTSWVMFSLVTSTELITTEHVKKLEGLQWSPGEGWERVYSPQFTSEYVTTNKVKISCNVKLFNNRGERLIQINQSVTSEAGILTIDHGLPRFESLKPLINEVYNKLSDSFQKRAPGKIKKMNKKLNK